MHLVLLYTACRSLKIAYPTNRTEWGEVAFLSRTQIPSSSNAAHPPVNCAAKGDVQTSSSLTPTRIPIACYGIGTVLALASCALREAFETCSGGTPVLQNDAGRCEWFTNDKTRGCTTMFDCYLPPVSEIMDAPYLQGKITTLEKHAKLTQRMIDGHHSPPAGENCLAVHVRRGDACNVPGRGCRSNDEYKDAVSKILRNLTNDAKDSRSSPYVYVMTDDATFPFAQWNLSFPVQHIDFDRSNLSTRILGKSENKSDYLEDRPEARNRRNELGTTAARDVFRDIDRARRCKAFVGTFAAALSQIVFLLMNADRGYQPQYSSMDGNSMESAVGRCNLHDNQLATCKDCRTT